MSSTEKDDQKQMESRLSRMGRKIIVMSGKGGVGKSSIAVNLAAALSLRGLRVGLMDVDFHGPSVPTMLGLEGQTILSGEDGLLPLEIGSLKVMSIGFMLPNPDDAVIWRGPMKMGVIKQFIKDVEWGDLDFLIIDSPPGTGDEPLSVCQLIHPLDGALIVTTPQKVAAVDVRKSVSFCKSLQIPVIGIVENMSGFVCPHCGEITSILRSGGGQQIATDMNVPFLGSIPMDPAIAQACDEGGVFIHAFEMSRSAALMREAFKPVFEMSPNLEAKTELNQTNTMEDEKMIIAIPLAEGILATHFGHCGSFALVEANPETRSILGRRDVDAPPHEPGLLPNWLAERGVHLVIAGGMGQRAQELFGGKGIQVVVGAPAEAPEAVVQAYLDGNLVTTGNVCDH